MNAFAKEDYIYSAKLTEIELYDSVIDLDELTWTFHSDRFKLIYEKTRPILYEEVMEGVHAKITFEMNLSFTEIQRVRFTIVQAVGEVGGLIAILAYFFAQLVKDSAFSSIECWRLDASNIDELRVLLAVRNVLLVHLLVLDDFLFRQV